MKADKQTESAVLALMERLWTAYSARNIDAVMMCFAADPDAVLIGTGADERMVGPDGIRALFLRDWSQSEASSMEMGWRSVSAARQVAWFSADATVHATVEGEDLHLPARLTAVLEQRDGDWLIVQLHGSLPAAGQEEGEAWPT